MPFQFHGADESRYTPGSLFLGYSATGHEVGIATERHAITVAGSRSGKGASLIVPNLLRWPHSGLIIDTKGDNAEATWQAREEMGQTVHVLDPFQEANVPDRLRANYNPLDDIDPAALSAREDIKVIADGMVLRHKAEDGEWYDGAVSVLAGFIAHAVSTYGPETRRLAVIRDMLNAPDGPPTKAADGSEMLSPFRALLAEMAENPACGGLAVTAAAMIGDGSKSAREFVSSARRSIDSFGADALRGCMAESSFRLSELKAGRCTVFLVLPSRYVEEHARFFRLFVRLALNAMERPLPNKSGPDRFKGTPCLFILDEFFSLGRIDAVYKAAGRMAGNGVHLWPFLQDLGQLVTLYGKDGAETFFGNSDARIFFGNTDQATLEYISRAVGRLTPDELQPDGPPARPHVPILPHEYAAGASHPPMRVHLPVVGKHAGAMAAMNFIGDVFHAGTVEAHNWNAALIRHAIEERHRAADVVYANARAAYDHAMRRLGTPRLTPEEVAHLTGKGSGEIVARSMIVFGPAGRCYNLMLAPYFLDMGKSPDPTIEEPQVDEALLHKAVLVWNDRLQLIDKASRSRVNENRAWLLGFFIIPLILYVAHIFLYQNPPTKNALGMFFIVSSLGSIWAIWANQRSYNAKMAVHERELKAAATIIQPALDRNPELAATMHSSARWRLQPSHSASNGG